MATSPSRVWFLSSSRDAEVLSDAVAFFLPGVVFVCFCGCEIVEFSFLQGFFAYGFTVVLACSTRNLLL